MAPRSAIVGFVGSHFIGRVPQRRQRWAHIISCFLLLLLLSAEARALVWR